MKRTLTILCVSVFCAAAAVRADSRDTRPNIVFILIDDMPWYGTSVRMDRDNPASAMAYIEMPNVEKLAKQGMTFRNARAAAGMCAPSRCSIQTGMMTARHLYSGNGGFGAKTDGTVEYLSRGKDATMPLLCPESQGNIRHMSVGEVLKTSGYATAHFGKWHLYGGGPEKHGYDESDGETDNKTFRSIDPATGEKTKVSEDPKFMFSITQRSMDFIERQAMAGKPFFLQLSHYANHGQYQARKATLEKYENNPVFQKITVKREQANSQLSGAMTEDLDTAIGQVLAKLDELGIANNTYVIFTSDNGHRDWNEGQEPLRGGKWWIWDGGLRVPLIVRGPGVQHGSHSEVNVVGYDWLPTIADLAGAAAHVPNDVDGVSLKPILLGQPVPESFVNRAIYFHYPHYRVSPPSSAIIEGDRKLLHFYEWPNGDFYYDLKADLGEQTNIATANPETARSLH
ncbi:MAG: sulfatase [Planctomycetaceae bacterium]|nr:sulfatase [Planctomycetales bacterium]MCB9925836.1 sulfatase [Planctomycetaceae bacterium]